jgi:hypothetical protein
MPVVKVREYSDYAQCPCGCTQPNLRVYVFGNGNVSFLVSNAAKGRAVVLTPEQVQNLREYLTAPESPRPLYKGWRDV